MTENESVSEYLHSLLREAFLSGNYGEYTAYAANEDKPLPWQVWTMGLLIVTISNIAAPLGTLLMPLMSKPLYDRFMTFLVALGVGAMSGSVMFILIPAAFSITELESFTYTSKSWLILSAVYGFFTVDRCLQFFLEFRRRKMMLSTKIHSSTLASMLNVKKKLKRRSKSVSKTSEASLGELSSPCKPPINEQFKQDAAHLRTEIQVQVITNNLVRTLSKRRRTVYLRKDSVQACDVRYQAPDGSSFDISALDDIAEDDSPTAPLPSPVDIESCKSPPPKGSDSEVGVSVQVVDSRVVSSSQTEVANVAYMIIFGSSANNFVDGMSTGAAFSDSLQRGLSIGLSVLSQQFPQELGTLAILISSGLGLRRTLQLNIIPVALSYAGFAVGVLLDNVDDSYDSYIYSVSAGMYFYIFLGTLLPEIRDSINSTLKTDLAESILTSILQFSGIMFGVAFMYLLSTYNDPES